MVPSAISYQYILVTLDQRSSVAEWLECQI